MPARRITLTKIRELALSKAASAGRPLHLSAASGLVSTGRRLYVVADDELHLGVFHESDAGPGRLVRLFPGTLPHRKKARKARKPDAEALTRLPPFAGCPHGALLALGSGSKRRRRRGALLALDANGAARGKARVLDLSGLYRTLGDHFAELNIEGAVVSGNELTLLQRGNKRRNENAVVRLNLSAVLDALGSGPSIGPITPWEIQRFDLGDIDGVPFCFTDGAALPNGDLVFTAIAEDSDSSYDDGPCAGAAIGIASAHGRLRCLRRLARPHKVEGVVATLEGGVVRLLLVTDADDADVAAALWTAVVDVG